MSRRNIIIIGAAVLVGLLAVYLANAYFTGVEERQARVAEQQRLVRVAVATQDLDFGTPLTAETVRLANWPAQSVPSGAITDLARLSRGEVAIRPIARGEPILASRISERAVLSENIPENMRAVTIAVNDVTGVAGFVTPGDAVDIFLTRTIGSGNSDQKITDVILENVQVAAIDRRASEKSTEPQALETATLLVDPYGAQKLALARQVGSLSMALRNVEEQQVGAMRTVTMADLAGARPYVAPRRVARSAPVRRRVARAAPRSAPAAAPEPVNTNPSILIYRGTEGERREVPRGSN